MSLLARARPQTLEAVLRDLGSRDARVRAETAQQAPNLVGDDRGELRTRVVEGLSRTLKDEHPAVRGAAALALADLDAHEALPALLVAAEDDEPTVRELAITALGEIGDPRSYERVRRALRDSRPEVRFQAIVAFPRIARAAETQGVDEEIWSALSAGLVDEDPLVRGRAAEACAELADGAKLPSTMADRLARLAADSEEPTDARIAATIALGESGDRRAAPVLLACLRGELDEKDPRRVQAIHELVGELKIEEARPLLLAASFGLRARFGDPSRRAAALIALIRLGERRAIDHVLSELDARGWERRVAALGIVARTRLVEARDRVRTMREDSMTADIAADVLAQLEGPEQTS